MWVFVRWFFFCALHSSWESFVSDWISQRSNFVTILEIRSLFFCLEYFGLVSNSNTHMLISPHRLASILHAQMRLPSADLSVRLRSCRYVKWIGVSEQKHTHIFHVRNVKNAFMKDHSTDNWSHKFIFIDSDRWIEVLGFLFFFSERTCWEYCIAESIGCIVNEKRETAFWDSFAWQHTIV